MTKGMRVPIRAGAERARDLRANRGAGQGAGQANHHCCCGNFRDCVARSRAILAPALRMQRRFAICGGLLCHGYACAHSTERQVFVVAALAIVGGRALFRQRCHLADDQDRGFAEAWPVAGHHLRRGGVATGRHAALRKASDTDAVSPRTPLCQTVGAMRGRSEAILFACAFGIAGSMLVAAPEARAQSADLVLCDRLAADPSDPDKPADVKGVAEIAPADIATAIRFCKVASASSRRALYQLGRAHAANRQSAEAMAAWRKAADKGSTSAMVELGVMYGTGAGVARDEAQARKLFERAAQAGNPRGVSNLAALGGGASSDPARGRELLSKAAETNAEAQYQLGMMLAEGNGGARDDTAARALFEKAAAQNHP